jgi:hypothetical protein
MFILSIFSKRNIFMKKVLVFSLAALAIGSVQAQNFAGVEFGSATTDVDTADVRSQAQYLANLTGQTVRWTIDESTTNVRFFGGKQLNKQTKLEVGYFRTGDISVNYKGVVFGEASTKGSASGFDASVIHDPFSNGFFVKAGLHSSKVSATYTESAYGFSESVSTSESGVGFLYGLGYEKQVADGINLRASYVFYNKIAGESSSDMSVITLGIAKSF